MNVSDFRNQEWLFPETTDNFDQLLIQYHGFCAHSIGVKGITLPGMLCSWTFSILYINTRIKKNVKAFWMHPLNVNAGILFFYICSFHPRWFISLVKVSFLKYMNKLPLVEGRMIWRASWGRNKMGWINVSSCCMYICITYTAAEYRFGYCC